MAKDGPYWVGFPDDYPGSCMGSTLTELMAEAEAILPWMACSPDGKPVADLSVAYVFADVPAEVSEDVRRYRELAAQRRELERKLSDLGSSTVSASAPWPGSPTTTVPHYWASPGSGRTSSGTPDRWHGDSAGTRRDTPPSQVPPAS